MASEKQYIELYEANEVLIKEGSCEPMNALRTQALVNFRSTGFPNRKVERYKYTNVEAAFAPNYGVNLKRISFKVDPYRAFKCSVPNMGTALYFMVGDCFYPSVQSKNVLPEGVFVGSIVDYSKENPDFVSKYYGVITPTKEDAVAALNTFLAQDGLLIRIEKGVKLDFTLQIVNLGRSEMNLMTNRRVLIVLEEGAEASILFCDHNMDDGCSFLTTQVNEIFMSAGSCLSIYGLEESSDKNVLFDNVYLRQEAGSKLECGYFTLHNGITRRTADVVFNGANCSAGIFGGVIGDNMEHTDINLLVDHKVAECKSNVLFKYVLDGKSVGAFAGKVLVRQGAQKTDSQETNANLCVSPQARMYTQPMLEIYADDVKCNHGSTVGRLDDRALFYMAQRGIPEDEANLLLQQAFLDEAIRRIQIKPLRERLTQMVEQRFRYKLNGCNGCDLCGGAVGKTKL